MCSARNASNPVLSPPNGGLQTKWQGLARRTKAAPPLCPPVLADLTLTRSPPQYSAPFLAEGFHQRSQRQTVSLPQIARVKFLQASLCYLVSSQPPQCFPLKHSREVEQRRKVTDVGFKTNPPFRAGEPPHCHHTSDEAEEYESPRVSTRL